MGGSWAAVGRALPDQAGMPGMKTAAEARRAQKRRQGWVTDGVGCVQTEAATGEGGGMWEDRARPRWADSFRQPDRSSRVRCGRPDRRSKTCRGGGRLEEQGKKRAE